MKKLQINKLLKKWKKAIHTEGAAQALHWCNPWLRTTIFNKYRKASSNSTLVRGLQPLSVIVVELWGHTRIRIKITLLCSKVKQSFKNKKSQIHNGRHSISNPWRDMKDQTRSCRHQKVRFISQQVYLAPPILFRQLWTTQLVPRLITRHRPQLSLPPLSRP